MGEAGADKRIAWLGSRVCTTLKVKEDVWKGIVNGESKYVLTRSHEPVRELLFVNIAQNNVDPCRVFALAISCSPRSFSYVPPGKMWKTF
jgi:hypothetical protein